MTTLSKFLAIALFALGCAITPVRAEDAAPAAATAAAKTPISIAVVDIQALLKNSKAAQGIDSQVQSLRKTFMAEVDQEEKTLRSTEKSILDQKSKLSEADFKAKAEGFQKQVVASQKKIKDRKDKLDQALAKAIGTLRTEIVKIVAEIGQKNGLDLVLARTDVVIVAKSMDITQEVLTRIDADLPAVKVTVE